MFTNRQWKIRPSIVVSMAFFLFLFFTLYVSGFAESTKVGISPHILKSDRKSQNFDFDFSLDEGYENRFEVFCTPPCEKFILVSFTVNKEHFWLKGSKKLPQEKGYATWSYNPHRAMLTVRIAPGKLSSQREVKLTCLAQGLSGQGPFSFTLKAYEEDKENPSFEFTDEVLKKASD